MAEESPTLNTERFLSRLKRLYAQWSKGKLSSRRTKRRFVHFLHRPQFSAREHGMLHIIFGIEHGGTSFVYKLFLPQLPFWLVILLAVFSRQALLDPFEKR